MSLYDASGHRKYLTSEERDSFLEAAAAAPLDVRTFCATLVYTGCRISEALQLTADRVDLKGGAIVFESLKKRKKGRLPPGAGAARLPRRAEHGSRYPQRPEAPGSRQESFALGLVAGYGLDPHAQLSTTSIYADAVGAEAKQIASRMW